VDTLNNIIDRINLSQAGVIASYDVGTDRLVLMQDLTKNPTAAQIAVGAATDTSNFLVATRFLSSLGTTQAVGTQRQDAVFAVDGVQYVRASNSPSDVIQGLTLALKGITTAPATVDVTTDTDRILNAITSFVVEYNTTIDLVNQQPLTAAERAYLEPLTDDDLAELTLEEIDEYNTRRNELRQRDFISRDSAMLAIARSLRQLVSGSVNNTGTFKSLAQVGLITASVGSSAEDARLNRGLLLSQTTDRELLEPLITGNVTLLAAVYGNPDALFDLFATTVESRLTLTGTRNLAGGISVSSNLRFTIGDGSGALATVSFAPGSYSATAVLNTVSSALIAAGLGETILPYYDSGYRLNLTSTRSDRRAEISLTDQSSGGDSLLATLGLNTGTNLGVDPYEYAGVARRTRSFISSQTGISGIIRERIRSGGTYDRQVENYESVIAQAEERLEAYEARLRNQFVHLETYLAEISDVSQYVEAYLAAQIAAASQYNQYA